MQRDRTKCPQKCPYIIEVYVIEVVVVETVRSLASLDPDLIILLHTARIQSHHGQEQT